ncbi:MAG: FecR family protein [Elusimicrobia bacterium]|nr:FecR family protein [Candidatus Obscuribacterium magneticum]
MRKFQIVFVLTVFGLSLRGSRAAEVIPAEEFHVTLAEGRAGLVPADARKASPARKGILILPGDRLITGKNGRVQMATREGSVLEIREESNLLVEEISDRTKMFFLKVGKLLGRIASLKERKNKSPYRIRTPVVLACARGTELALNVDENQELQAGVMEGEVEFEKERIEEEPAEELKPVEVLSSATVTSSTAAEVAPEGTAPEGPSKVVVGKSEGLIANPGKPIVKTNEIPPLLVSSLDWFKQIREQIPTLKEEWKALDYPSRMKLRQGVLRENITWEVPKKLGLDLEPPSKQLEKKPSPARIAPPKRDIPKPR